MSSESEIKQDVMDSGSSEERSNDDSEYFKSKSEDSTSEEEKATSEEGNDEREDATYEEGKDSSSKEEDATYEEGKDATSKEDAKPEEEKHSTSYSKNNGVYTDDDIPAQCKSVDIKKENFFSSEPQEDWKTKLLEECERFKDKCLFVQFPTTTKNFCSRVIGVRRASKNKRHFFVDFDSIEDRTEALKELKKIKIDGEQVHITISTTDDEEFVANRIENEIKKIAAREAKAKSLRPAKRAAKKAAKKANNMKKQTNAVRTFTSTLIVQNIPLESTISDIKNIFPNAIDIKLNFSKGTENTTTATVKLHPPQDSIIATQKIYKIGEKELKLSVPVPNEKERRHVKVMVRPNPDQAIGQAAHKFPNSKGKHKLEEPPGIELSLQEKKTKKSKQKKRKGKADTETEELIKA